MNMILLMNMQLLKSYETHHNYFEKHVALDGMTPSGKYGIEINVNS